MIEIKSIETLSKFFFTLSKVTFNFQKSDGSIESQVREVYDNGSGATVLLYNKSQRTVILIRQLRIASHLNGNPGGLLIETCAGLLEGNDPEATIKKEIAEETGYEISEVKKVMEIYTSPGANSELLHCFTAEYNADQKKYTGGGLQDEQEEIEVLEVPFAEAWKWLEEGKIRDAKTVILLQHLKLKGLL